MLHHGRRHLVGRTRGNCHSRFTLTSLLNLSARLTPRDSPMLESCFNIVPTPAARLSLGFCEGFTTPQPNASKSQKATPFLSIRDGQTGRFLPAVTAANYREEQFSESFQQLRQNHLQGSRDDAGLKMTPMCDGSATADERWQRPLQLQGNQVSTQHVPPVEASVGSSHTAGAKINASQNTQFGRAQLSHPLPTVGGKFSNERPSLPNPNSRASSLNLSSNIYLPTPFFLKNLEHVCYTLVWPENREKDHVELGRKMAWGLRDISRDHSFTYMSDLRAIAGMRVSNRRPLRDSLTLDGGFFLRDEPIVFQRTDWKDVALQWIQRPAAFESTHADDRSLNAEGTGPSAIVMATNIVNHLYKVYRESQILTGSKIMPNPRGPGSTIFDCRLRAIDCDGLPAVAIDYLCTASIPLADVRAQHPNVDLVGAKVRTRSGPHGEIIAVQPLTESKREELLKLSKVRENQEAIRKASPHEMVYTVKPEYGFSTYQWIGSDLSIEEHLSSLEIEAMLRGVEIGTKVAAKLPPRERQKVINEFASIFSRPPNPKHTPYLEPAPVSSVAEWGKGSVHRKFTGCFGRRNPSATQREFGNGYKLPLDPNPTEISRALRSSGLFRLGKPPVKLGVLYTGLNSNKVQMLKTLVSGKVMVDDVSAVLQRSGVLTREEVTFRELAGLPNRANTRRVIQEFLEEDVGFLLVLSSFEKNSLEGQDCWIFLKDAGVALGLPSQMVNESTLRHWKTKQPLKARELEPVIANILCCTALKLGHIPWRLIPVFDSVDCIVGMDVCKGTVPRTGTEDTAAGVMVFTRGGDLSFQFTHDECDGETVTEKFLRKAIQGKDVAKQRVAVIRHGPFRGAEIAQISAILEENGATGVFIEVIERTNVRIFSTSDKHAPLDAYLQTSPTTCYIVASQPFAGTAQLLKLVLRKDNLGLDIAEVRQIVGLSRRLPCGSVLNPKLPFQLHTVDKLAYKCRQIGRSTGVGNPWELAF